MVALLPNEIWEQILEYLDTFELIQFCIAFPNLDYFLEDGKVVKTIDFARKFVIFNIDVCQFIFTKVNYNAIKTLKIDGLYWIPAQDLRKLVRDLKSLKELCAVDTNLSLKENDIVEYGKLTRLSLTVEDTHFEPGSVIFAKYLVNLKYMFLKITSKLEDHITGASNVISFFARMDQLKELWISDDEESVNRIDYERIAVSLPNLSKLVIKSKCVIPYYDLRYLGLFKVFECKRCNFETEFICERVRTRGSICKPSIFEPKGTALENAWDVFMSLHKDMPCGSKESRQIYLSHNIKEVSFVDLNFCQAVILCNTKYTNAALEILSSKNCKFLRRLSFRSCLFSTEELEKLARPTTSFKKQRIGVQTKADKHPFCKITKKLKSLKELEVYYCPNCVTGGSIAGYISISMLTKLEKLSLDIPYLLDGSFLEEALKKCKKLHTLSLTCDAANEKFIINLCKGLKHANSLKNFRLVYKEIAIDRLFDSFNSIKEKKLQRMFLSCDNIKYATNKSELEVYTDFFQEHTQLIFFFVVASKHTAKQNTDIQSILNIYKADNPAKIFLIHKDTHYVKSNFPLPNAHHDLVLNRTNVSVIHFDEFY
nr:unnamed protein product [Callosobruchus chinensis]